MTQQEPTTTLDPRFSSPGATATPWAEVKITAAKSPSGGSGSRNRGAISGATTGRTASPNRKVSNPAKPSASARGRVRRTGRGPLVDCVAMVKVLPAGNP